MIRKLFIAALAAISLGGCAIAAVLVADAPTIIATGDALLAAYKATATPSPTVVDQAQALLESANAAVAKYGATSEQALLDGAALAGYLASAAPGNGTTAAVIATDAPSAIKLGTDLLAAYKLTPNPSLTIEAQAQTLLDNASAAITAYGATSNAALAATAFALAYVATTAPGNGVTAAPTPAATVTTK